MLTIIHGDDVSASRKFFLSEKDKIENAVVLRSSEVTLTNLAQVLEGGGLFEEIKTVFVEDFLSDRKKSAERDAIILYIAKKSKDNNIVMWEGKQILPSSFSKLKGSAIKTFKLSSSLFTFLDNIKPKNGKALVDLHHKCLKTIESEMIFFMIVRQFRIMLALIDFDKESISETNRLAPWQRGKIEKQARLFDREKLVRIYRKLFKIEVAQKTGGLNIDLINTIDFLLIEL